MYKCPVKLERELGSMFKNGAIVYQYQLWGNDMVHTSGWMFGKEQTYEWIREFAVSDQEPFNKYTKWRKR